MLSLAQTYAILIDEGRFDDLAPILDEECHYRYFEGNYQGRGNIINMFRHNREFAAKTFDEIHYSSSISQLTEDTFKILMLDRFHFHGAWQEQPSKQIIKIKDGLIVDIEEFEVVGQISAQLPS